MSEEVTRRRWLPRYSLRTLFVVVTLVCVWLGWQVNFVRERNAILKVVRDMGGVASKYRNPYSYAAFKNLPTSRISFMRRLLGDNEVGYILMPAGTDEQRMQQLRDRFPESEIEISAYPAAK